MTGSALDKIHQRYEPTMHAPFRLLAPAARAYGWRRVQQAAGCVGARTGARLAATI